MQLQRMHCQSLKSQLCPCGSSLVSLEVFSRAQILLMVQTTAICHSNFSFSSFFISLFWNLEICSSLFLLFIPVFFSALSCPSFYSFLLLFLLPVLFSPSLFIHFIFWSTLLFSFQICYPFFSFLFSHNSILSSSPLCPITIQSVLFLLELSIWYFFAISFYSCFCFLYTPSFYKDLMTLLVLCSYLSTFSLSLYSLSVLFVLPFCSFLFALVFFSFSVLLFPLFYMLLLFLLFIFFCILTPSFFIYFYSFFSFLIIFLVLYFVSIAWLLLPTD